jgi:hypothetical protein
MLPPDIYPPKGNNSLELKASGFGSYEQAKLITI